MVNAKVMLRCGWVVLRCLTAAPASVPCQGNFTFPAAIASPLAWSGDLRCRRSCSAIGCEVVLQYKSFQAFLMAGWLSGSLCAEWTGSHNKELIIKPDGVGLLRFVEN